MLKDEIEKKNQLRNETKKDLCQSGLTCQTRDPGPETKITSYKASQKKL
jgi:hypothetical protein